jgi:hypothetical protein
MDYSMNKLCRDHGQKCSQAPAEVGNVETLVLWGGGEDVFLQLSFHLQTSS